MAPSSTVNIIRPPWRAPNSRATISIVRTNVRLSSVPMRNSSLTRRMPRASVSRSSSATRLSKFGDDSARTRRRVWVGGPAGSAATGSSRPMRSVADAELVNIVRDEKQARVFNAAGREHKYLRRHRKAALVQGRNPNALDGGAALVDIQPQDVCVQQDVDRLRLNQFLTVRL